MLDRPPEREGCSDMDDHEQAPPAQPEVPPPPGAIPGPAEGSTEPSTPQPGVEPGDPAVAPSTIPPQSPTPPRRRSPVSILVIALVVVAAIAIGAIVAAERGSPAATPTPAPASTQGPPRIATLTATAVSPIEVDLQWSVASGDVAQFVLLRNDKQVAAESNGITAYKDTTLLPAHAYTYSIQATDQGGRQSVPVTATASTPPAPPLADARFQGQFVIKAKFVSENFTNFHVGQVETEAWRFTPQCPEGPCKVKVDLFAPQQKLAVAGRKGGRTPRRAPSCWDDADLRASPPP